MAEPEKRKTGKKKKGKEKEKTGKEKEKKLKDILKVKDKKCSETDVHLVSINNTRHDIVSKLSNDSGYYNYYVYQSLILYSPNVGQFRTDIAFIFVRDGLKYEDYYNYITSGSKIYFEQIFFSNFIYNKDTGEFEKESIICFINKFIKYFFSNLFFNLEIEDVDVEYLFMISITTEKSKNVYFAYQGKFFFIIYNLTDDNQIKNTDFENFELKENVIRNFLQPINVKVEKTKKYYYLNKNILDDNKRTNFYSFRLNPKNTYSIHLTYLELDNNALKDEAYTYKLHNFLIDEFKVKRVEYHKEGLDNGIDPIGNANSYFEEEHKELIFLFLTISV